MATCPEDGALVEPRIDRVLTQYRESPKLLHVLRTHLREVERVIQSVCDLPSFFDIETAVGEQLTFLGKRLGWPRCHCICEVQPVFGFECPGFETNYPISGFCDDNASWIDCGAYVTSDICIDDDEIYRKFLKVRRYQMLAMFDIQSLEEAVRIFWGDTAWVPATPNGQVIIAPGRALTEAELKMLKLYPRVLPVSPGIRILIHFNLKRIFGFGEGWGGFCSLFPLVTDEDDFLITDGDDFLSSSELDDPEWLCPIDVYPYECI